MRRTKCVFLIFALSVGSIFVGSISLTPADAVSSPQVVPNLFPCSATNPTMCIELFSLNGEEFNYVGNGGVQSVDCSQTLIQSKHEGENRMSWCADTYYPVYANSQGQAVRVSFSQDPFVSTSLSMPQMNKAQQLTKLTAFSFGFTNISTTQQMLASTIEPNPNAIQDVGSGSVFSVRLNFGSLPAPNAFLQTEINHYTSAVNASGHTVVDLSLTASQLSSGGDPCVRDQALYDRITFGNIRLATYEVRYIGKDPPGGRFAGIATSSNGVCMSSVPLIAPDGGITIPVAGPHLRADGSLNEGRISLLLSPETMQSFELSANQIISNGMNITRTGEGKKQALSYTSQLMVDGSVLMRSTGFHFSSAEVTYKKSKRYRTPKVKTRLTIGQKFAVKRGRSTTFNIQSKVRDGSVLIFIRDAKNNTFNLGRASLANGKASLNAILQRGAAKGKAQIFVWYEGSSRVAPATSSIQTTIK